MPARSFSQGEIDAIAAKGREMLRAERLAAAPEVVNLGPVLQLGEAIPLLWNGTEYRVKPISYREGVRLQRAALEVERMMHAPATTPEEMDVREAFVVEVLDLFHTLLEPAPPVNPFVAATPWEVGELLGFFFACQTKQSGPSRSRMGRPSTSTMH